MRFQFIIYIKEVGQGGHCIRHGLSESLQGETIGKANRGKASHSKIGQEVYYVKVEKENRGRTRCDRNGFQSVCGNGKRKYLLAKLDRRRRDGECDERFRRQLQRVMVE